MYAERMFVYYLATQFAMLFSAFFNDANTIMRRSISMDRTENVNKNKHTELWRWYYISTLKVIATRSVLKLQNNYWIQKFVGI